MKASLLLLLPMLASMPASAEEPMLEPMKAIEQYGSITIGDGSSWFTFKKGGSFLSGPLSMSGRSFEGHWEVADHTFTVTAKLGWINGLSSGKEYRRIKFVIYDVRKLPVEEKPTLGFRPNDMFGSYFIIDELVKIPAPADAKEK